MSMQMISDKMHFDAIAFRQKKMQFENHQQGAPHGI